jgi:hypothetical protein
VAIEDANAVFTSGSDPKIRADLVVLDHTGAGVSTWDRGSAVFALDSTNANEPLTRRLDIGDIRDGDGKIYSAIRSICHIWLAGRRSVSIAGGERRFRKERK